MKENRYKNNKICKYGKSNILHTIGILSLFSIMMNNAYAATTISATTVESIYGHAPTFDNVDDKAINKLGFKIDNVYLNKLNDSNTELTYLEPLKSLTATVAVEPLIKGTDYNIVDIDEDHKMRDPSSDPNNPTYIDDPEAKIEESDFNLELVDSAGTVIDLATLSDTTTICDLNSAGTYVAPYTVKVAAKYTPITRKGIPSMGDAVEVKQNYTFDVDSSCSGSGKILFLRPKDSLMSYETPDPDVFEQNKGFKPDARSLAGDRAFPSVGFLYAQFYVDVEGEQDKFDIEIVDPDNGNVLIDYFTVTGNKVFFKKEFIGKAQVQVKRKSNNRVVSTHDFEIKDWFKRPASTEYTYCAYSPKRGDSCNTMCDNEISPFRGAGLDRYAVPQPWQITSAGSGVNSRGKRQIATLVGEWGAINLYDYTDSELGGGSYIPSTYITRQYVKGTNLSMITVSSGSGQRYNVPVTANTSPLLCWIGRSGDERINRPEISE